MVANAKRYVWLRDECIESKNPQHTWIVESPPDMWDEAIDAAMNNDPRWKTWFYKTCRDGS